MANPFRRLTETNSIRRDAEELTSLAKKYLKEETIDPLKALGQYAIFGCAGSLFVGLGTLLLLVGILRLLQTETTAFQGHLSWLPYLIVVLLGVIIMGLVGWRIVSGPAKRRLANKKKEL